MDDKNKDLLPPTTPQETVVDIAAVITSIVPWVGAPISAVLTGISLTRKIDRVREVLVDMAAQIKDFQSEASEKYVQTDEFQDLAEKALRQAAEERSHEKLKAYAAFLANDIKSPGEPYDEKLRLLGTLEVSQPDHIRVLKALLQEPDMKFAETMLSGSFEGTLQRRLPDLQPERIADLAQQLTDMRLAQAQSLKGMMTARGAEELQHLVTPYGRRFIQFIVSSV